MSSPFAHAHFKQCLIGNVKHGDGFDSLTFDVLNKNGEPLNKMPFHGSKKTDLMLS